MKRVRVSDYVLKTVKKKFNLNLSKKNSQPEYNLKITSLPSIPHSHENKNIITRFEIL